MYPPISANSRVALSDDVITTKGIRYFVPSGTHIGWSSYQMQQRLDIWGPDAKVWNPTRWLDHASVPANNAAAFQAWGIGPRIVRISEHPAKFT
jgi:cytochrome P450